MSNGDDDWDQDLPDDWTPKKKPSKWEGEDEDDDEEDQNQSGEEDIDELEREGRLESDNPGMMANNDGVDNEEDDEIIQDPPDGGEDYDPQISDGIDREPEEEDQDEAPL